MWEPSVPYRSNQGNFGHNFNAEGGVVTLSDFLWWRPHAPPLDLLVNYIYIHTDYWKSIHGVRNICLSQSIGHHIDLEYCQQGSYFTGLSDNGEVVVEMDVRLALGVSGNKGNQPDTGRLGNLVRRHDPQAVEAEFEPRVDWSETPEAHILIADVPGFTKDDVGVQIDNWGNLTISGHRRLEETTTVGWPWPRTERRHGRTLTFSKVFNVPDNLNFDAISAKFEHETLYVVMPKSDGAGRELPGAEGDRPRTEVEGSSPVGAPIPPAATELEETAKETEPEDADRNQEGSSSEIQVIQVPRVMDDDLKDDKRMHLAGGGEEENDDQRTTGEIEAEEEISRPSALHEKGLPSELNIEDQPKDGDRKPTMEELAEGSDELPAGSEIGIAEEGNLPSDDKSTEKRGPGLNIRSKLPVFSKRKAVLVSSVVVLCVGLYISYRLRQAEH